MSQGLGTTQRKVLVCLYVAKFDSGTAPMGNLTYFYGNGVWGYGVTQVEAYEERQTRTKGSELSTAERELRRSQRVPLRRALKTLASRGLVTCDLTEIKLSELGQPNWADKSTRNVWLANITDEGCDYVEERRVELAKEFARFERFFEILESGGFHDLPEKERPPKPAKKTPKRPPPKRARARAHKPRPGVVAPVPPREQLYDRDGAIQLLVGEGFDEAAVRTAMRRWHREEQRAIRVEFRSTGGALEEFRSTGGALEEFRFGAQEIDDLRALLAPDAVL
ncbi:hypothetical protein ACWDSF_33145 [Nocardia beijingensis]